MTKDTHNYSLRLPPDLYRALSALAGVRAISMSQLMIELLEEGWQKAPEKDALLKIITPVATPVATPKEPKAEAKPKGSKAKKA